MITDKCAIFLTCPIDGEDMKVDKGVVCCSNKHSFDISQEGYVNMLTNKKRFRKDVGDSKEMVLARAKFLGEGHYDFLSERINQMVIENLQDQQSKIKRGQAQCVLEAGSGTAFYLNNLKTAIEKEMPSVSFCYFGTDVSKYATQFSAKKHKEISFMVADTYTHLPFKNDAVSVLLNIFSPRNPKEFKRLLGNHGLLVSVIPNDNHIQELIEKLGLLKIEEEKEKNVFGLFNDFFEKVAEQDCERVLVMKPDSIKSFVEMGPNKEYVDEEMIDAIESLGDVKVTTSFKIILYRPRKE